MTLCGYGQLFPMSKSMAVFVVVVMAGSSQDTPSEGAFILHGLWFLKVEPMVRRCSLVVFIAQFVLKYGSFIQYSNTSQAEVR